MKRILITAAILLASIAASAQTSFGLGYCMTNEWFKYLPTQTINGPYISLGHDFELSDIFSLAPELVVQTGFGKIDKDYYIAATEDGSRKYVNLNLPIFVKMGMDFSGKVRGFFELGPEIQFGLIARDRHDGLVINYYGNDDVAFRRFNIGVTGGIGVDFGKYSRVCTSYSYGLLNNSKISGTRNHIGYFRIGYCILFR